MMYESGMSYEPVLLCSVYQQGRAVPAARVHIPKQLEQFHE